MFIRWNRFVVDGDKQGDGMDVDAKYLSYFFMATNRLSRTIDETKATQQSLLRLT